MSSRILLTLLALLTGLTAHGAPAQASVQSACGQEIGAAATYAMASQAALRASFAHGGAAHCKLMRWSLEIPHTADEPEPVPSVRIGVDRARE